MTNSIAGLFTLLFFYTGISKLLNYDSSLSQSERLPFFGALGSWIEWMVAILELAAATLLIRARWRLTGFYICLALTVLFIIYMLLLINYTDGINCSCGGILEQIPPNIHLALNIFLVLLVTVAIRLQTSIKRSLRNDYLADKKILRVKQPELTSAAQTGETENLK